MNLRRTPKRCFSGGSIRDVLVAVKRRLRPVSPVPACPGEHQVDFGDPPAGDRHADRRHPCADDFGGPAPSNGMAQGTDHSVEEKP